MKLTIVKILMHILIIVTKVNDGKHTIDYASKKQSLLTLGGLQIFHKAHGDYLVLFIYLVSRWYATKHTCKIQMSNRYIII